MTRRKNRRGRGGEWARGRKTLCKVLIYPDYLFYLCLPGFYPLYPLYPCKIRLFLLALDARRWYATDSVLRVSDLTNRESPFDRLRTSGDAERKPEGARGRVGEREKNLMQGIDLPRLSFLSHLSLFTWFLSPVSSSSLLNPPWCFGNGQKKMGRDPNGLSPEAHMKSVLAVSESNSDHFISYVRDPFWVEPEGCSSPPVCAGWRRQNLSSVPRETSLISR